MVNVDGNHQIVVQQHMMAGRMVYREVDAPLEHIGIHGAGRAFILAGDNLHPVAAAESIVGTHALERMGLTWVGARKACQLVFANPISDLDCQQITFTGFQVLPSDPHGFGGNNNRIGYES